MKIYKTTVAQRQAARQWRLDNPERYAELQRAYRAGGGPLSRRRKYPAEWAPGDVNRFVQFGLRPEDVRTKLAEQGGCAICATPEPRGKNSWHIDHDHATGHLRGILCITCNIALGMLHDDPERARAAAAYLDKSRQLQELF